MHSKKLKDVRQTITWILFTILMAGMATIICSCGVDAKQVKKSRSDSKQEEKTEAPFEMWQKEKGKILSNVTGTSSIVLPDGSLRCYFSEGGYVRYIESKDGKTFGESVATNIGSGDIADSMQNPVNPAVLRMRSGRFLLLYNTGSGIALDRAEDKSTKLNLAYSDDGTLFELGGVVADLEKDATAVVSDVDLVLLSDGTIRLYGSNNGVSTAVSKDGGRTWITDGFELLGADASDPDVYIKPDGSYVMYYAVSVNIGQTEKADEQKRAESAQIACIKIALSKDGRSWKPMEGKILTSDKDKGAVFKPDFVNLANNNGFMYFCESSGAVSESQAQTNVRLAVKK